MIAPNLKIIRIPSMTMLFAGEKCLYKIVHCRYEKTKNHESIKPGYYIVPTGFAGATINQTLTNRRFRSQKQAVDFCRSALRKFHRLITKTSL